MKSHSITEICEAVRLLMDRLPTSQAGHDTDCIRIPAEKQRDAISLIPQRYAEFLSLHLFHAHAYMHSHAAARRIL